MKRKVTELEQKLIENGWYLATKRYTGRGSNKILCYEYQKTSDIRNNGKTYKQIIRLNQKRTVVVGYGIANLQIEYLNDDELMVIRFVFFELRKFVQKISWVDTKLSKENSRVIPLEIPSDFENELPKEKRQPMTPEQLDELNEEIENGKGDID